jgi:type VII secretion-associated serine protease mycosin
MASPAAQTAKPPVLETPADASPTLCPNLTQLDIPASETAVKTTPWAQNALNFTKAWPISRGANVTIAVLDSGVDYTPQLAGRVSAIDETSTGISDCVGHGTAVAGIIAAADDQDQGNPFAGVAPDAKILSVKVANAESTNLLSPETTGDSKTLSQGIIDAVNDGASVLNISITSNYSLELAEAVAYAESRNVVVVAAGGNDATGDPVGPFFPASFPGVLSVGALDPNGSLASFADPNTQESVTAPGVNITSTSPSSPLVPVGYNAGLVGTSFATPFVAGVAALILSRYPSMTAAEVVARIEATAVGSTGTVTGNGMVDPLQAVQASMPLSVNPDPTMAQPQSVSISRRVPPDQGAINAAMLTTLGSAGGAALVVVAVLVISVGRRRRRAAAAQGPAANTADASVPSGAGLSDGPLW